MGKQFLFVGACVLLFCLAWFCPGVAGAADTIVINTSYSPPLSAPAGDGVFDLVLKEAFGRLGYDLRMQMLPAERSFQDADSGVADGDVGRIAGVEKIYTNLRMVPEPVLESRDFVGFVMGEPFPVQSWEDLGPYHVGYVRGWKIFENGSNDAASATAVQSTRQLFELLARDRIDVALSARLDGLAMAKELDLESIAVLEPPFASMKMYLYLHKRHEPLLAPLAQTLREMKADGTYARLTDEALRRYTDL